MWLMSVQAEAQEYLVSCDCPNYLRKAEKRLAEEVERVRNYMDPGSEAKITRVVETELIQKQVGLVGDFRGPRWCCRLPDYPCWCLSRHASAV